MFRARSLINAYPEVPRLHARNLFREKKLVLLVDLDLTLIHTSSYVNRGCEIEGIQPIYFEGSAGGATWLRLRPGAKEFLQNLSSTYEMYVCTMGTLPYARAVLQVLDPDQAIFKGRIVSREYYGNSKFKTSILSRIFYNGDQSMISIIDDNAFVWSNNPSLIKVREYTFFNEHGSASVTAHQDDKDRYLQELELSLKQIHSDFFSQQGVNPLWTIILNHMRSKKKPIVQPITEASAGCQTQIEKLQLIFNIVLFFVLFYFGLYIFSK